MTLLLRFLACLLVIHGMALAQSSIPYSTQQAHSHNDYEQTIPFWQAYYQQFGSIEADLFLRGDSLYVAHNKEDIAADRTFYNLYLKPIIQQTSKNKGTIYADPARKLQLLVDLKTGAKETLAALVHQLAPYSALLAPKGTVKVVISGNTPDPADFDQYPDFIFFDGRPSISYSPKQLERIGLISQSFSNYTHWNGKGILVEKDRQAIEQVIDQVHSQGKKIRFWATPDHVNAWKILMNLGLDYLNTDRVTELGAYLRGRPGAEYQEKDTYIPYPPTYRNNDARSKVKNIILLIGDGMGLTQIYAGMTANRGRLNLSQFLNIGFSKTSSADSYITDSAAGATAMATGHKTRNRAIGVDTSGKPLPAIPMQIRQWGMKSGVISAGNITDATPASFYAHQPERDWQQEIARDFIKSPADILIGGGFRFFNHPGLIDTLKNNGYQIANSWSALNTLKAPFILLDDKVTTSKLNGRKDFLTKAFQKTCQALESNPNGFFIMAEGAQIDNGGHANKLPYVVTEMLDFDQLVGEALRYADSNGETLVIVTADHETGGLSLLDGDLKKGYIDGHFSTNDHTSVMVPVFAYGPHSLDFRGVYENTAIHSKIMELVKRYKKR